MRLSSLLVHRASRHPELPAVVDHRVRLTFRELRDEVASLARRLRARGLLPGDRVALLAKNRAEHVIGAFAVPEAALVLVPVNWRLTEPEVVGILEHSGARLVLAEAPFTDRLRSLALPEGLEVVDLDDGEPWPARVDPLPRLPEPPDTAPVVQLYTSGTTGLPKGALLDHRAVLASALVWRSEGMPMRPGDRYLQVTPQFHVGAYVMATTSVAAGATLVIHREFAPDLAALELARGGVTHALFVPAMIRWMLDEPRARGLAFPALRRVLYGGSPMQAPLLREAMARFGEGVELIQGYGLTETLAVITVLDPDDHRRVAAGEDALAESAGRALLGSDIRVVGPDDEDLPLGEAGEVVARSPHLASGYHEAPAETEAAFRGGWFHTGDVGRLDERGYLTLVDRLKDMIVVGGEKVFPSEVEAVLRRLPGVADVAVVGAPHDVWGERVVAVVVPEDRVGDPAAQAAWARALIRGCRAELAAYKCPSQVDRVTELPRNAAGKVAKAALRAPYWAGRDRKV